MTAPLQQILSELKSELEKLYGERLVRVILYGSQARGDALPDSDVDILVVLGGVVNVSDEIQRVVPVTAQLSLRYGTLLACTFASSHQYDDDIDEPLLINVRREGLRL